VVQLLSLKVLVLVEEIAFLAQVLLAQAVAAAVQAQLEKTVHPTKVVMEALGD
jgi:hypothetical protein